MFNLLSQLNPFNLIPPQYTVWAKAIAYLVAVVFVFGLGWSVNGWRLNLKYEKLINDHQQEMIDQINAIQQQRDEAQKKVSEIDLKLTQERTYARKKINELRGLINDGVIRLSVPSSTELSASGNTGSGNGTSRCDIDRSTAQNLVAITQEGDDAIQQLTACQNILRGLQ